MEEYADYPDQECCGAKQKKRRGARLRTLVTLALILGILFAGRGQIKELYSRVRILWTEKTPAQLQVLAFASENGLSFFDYPSSLIDLLDRNPETADFVLNYPLREELETDMSEYSRSQVPLLMQWDPRWGYEKYGSDLVGITGCGPLCLAMAGYYLTGDEAFAPDKMVEFAARNGYYSKGNGSSWTLVSEGGPKLGLTVTEIPLVKKRILDNLAVGNPIICAMGPGDFTTSGHYIVLTGTEDGMIRLNDPNSYANSEKLWTYEEMESQFRNLWVIQ